MLESLSPAFPDLKEWFVFSIKKISKVVSKHGPQPALISSVLLKKLGTQDVQNLVQTLKEELKKTCKPSLNQHFSYDRMVL